MSIIFDAATIEACSALVITLDQHRFGAVAFVFVLLSAGVAVALSKWRK